MRHLTFMISVAVFADPEARFKIAPGGIEDGLLFFGFEVACIHSRATQQCAAQATIDYGLTLKILQISQNLRSLIIIAPMFLHFPEYLPQTC